MELRDYQAETIVKLRQSLATGHRRPCVQAPTGAGKTVIAAAIINMALAKYKRVMFVVPMLSLIDQTVLRFQDAGINDIGVMQGNHEMTDPRQPVQVCSMQTLMRRDLPDVDLVIVDEAHVQYKFLIDWIGMEAWSKIPFVGLTATPWARGMGKVWDDLIIATTTSVLIEKGVLSDFKVYAPAHPDLTGVRTRMGDYAENDLAKAMNKPKLVADIVSTWIEKASDRPTICFAVDCMHAKHIQQQFEAANIAAGYMDAYTDREERAAIVRQFEAREIKVICNVGVLTTGFDSDVRCIILARPTRSEILYTQMIGRGLRKAPGKDHCLILDHSDTTLKLGFVTDIHHDALDDGERKRAVPEKREALPKECPKCAYLRPPKVRTCPACGFEATPVNTVESEMGELYELTREKSIRATEWPIERKQAFWSELLLHAHMRGYKRGWAYWAYRHRMNVGPANSLQERLAQYISPATEAWIRHYNILKAKQREKSGAAAVR